MMEPFFELGKAGNCSEMRSGTVVSLGLGTIMASTTLTGLEPRITLFNNENSTRKL